MTTDQRGLPRMVDAAVDIGAFESSGFTLAIVAGNNQSTPVGSAFPKALEVSVTANNAGEPVDGGVVTFTAPASGAVGDVHFRRGRSRSPRAQPR